jgi:hypothetical protein
MNASSARAASAKPVTASSYASTGADHDVWVFASRTALSR